MISYFVREQEKGFRLNSSIMISTYLVLEIALDQICIMIHTLDNISMIPPSYYLQASNASQNTYNLIKQVLVPKPYCVLHG
jgi:hypothetical protein